MRLARVLAGRFRSLHASTVVASTVLAVAGVAAGIYLTSSPGTYRVNAVFPSAQGLFAGAPVQLLGVRVGTVSDVEYAAGAVHVTMEIAGGQELPAGARAALITPLLLGQPNVELSPGYTGGPTMAAGGTIPESRTAVPVSTDALLKQLQRVLGSVNPSSLHGLVANLATDLAGQGSQLHQLISSASGTLQLLAEKGNDLGKMDGSLAQLTGTLRANESQLLDLVQQYEVVSGVIASHQQALGSSITDLSKMSAQLAALLSPNLKPLEQDVAVIATAGRTLDRNLSNLDSIMASTRSLFAAGHRAYDPVHHWLNLNNQLAPGLTASMLEGLIRDRLAGICRRVLAHHAAGLSAGEKATLATCGNPASGYFDPILGLVPTLIAKGGLDNPGAPGAGSLLAPGLSKIPGLSGAAQHKITSAASAASSSAAPSPAGTSPGSGTGKQAGGKAARSTSKCGSSLDAAINCLLGPLPSLSANSQGAATSSGGSVLLGTLFGTLGIPALSHGGLW